MKAKIGIVGRDFTRYRISPKTDDKQNAQSKQSVSADVSAAKVDHTTRFVLLLFQAIGAETRPLSDTANTT